MYQIKSELRRKYNIYNNIISEYVEVRLLKIHCYLYNYIYIYIYIYIILRLCAMRYNISTYQLSLDQSGYVN